MASTNAFIHVDEEDKIIIDGPHEDSTDEAFYIVKIQGRRGYTNLVLHETQFKNFQSIIGGFTKI